MAAKKTAAAAKVRLTVAAHKHKDKRSNIPTEELRDFVADEELAPRKILYPRDPSLDPQLVWKGKDEQDRQPLEVPAVPIYIQEKIHPQVIIEEVRSESKKGAPQQATLFADFNGIKFEDLIDFYHHEQNWANRFILGDSLLVMTSLAEKEGLKGKVQCLYFDPPYGINFGSNWQVSTRKRDVKDGKAEDATRQPEQIRAFRDTWKLGIHSYLAYLRDRLTAARELLTESGSVFVQIGDENVHLVRSVLDEVFGSENFVAEIFFRKTGAFPSETIASVADILLWYAKSKPNVKVRHLFGEKGENNTAHKGYDSLEIKDGSRRRLLNEERDNLSLLQEGSKVFSAISLESGGWSETGSAPFSFQGKTFSPRENAHWKTTAEGLKKLAMCNRIVVSGNTLRYVMYQQDFPVLPLSNMWTDVMGATGVIYVVQTNEAVTQRCLLMTTDPGDLVLDPTCGSGTTAYVAEQWGRRWITIDTSRVAVALARTRLMAAKYPYYLLADSPEGVRKEAELTGKLALSGAEGTPPNYKTENDIKRGFVSKRVPHVTLKSIANNADIKEGMSRAEIDRAIAKHADIELLYDQPYVDSKRVRVCGPFSVESLSPHRVLPTADDNQDGTVSELEGRKQQDFEAMILDNLVRAGVQNTKKRERIKFETLVPYAGMWLHATGTYTDVEEKTKRVAVCIGPEQGTVGPQLVKDAAKEAVQGVGFDLLLVCGFAFDPHVSEEAKRYGKLVVLPTKMNPDLAMGDELLKKTGAGNLFMVFGEPDVKISKRKGGEISVEIKGMDVYDPTTGEVRSSSTDDIACWFIDTDYNGESFFVRHAYFLGAGEPYEKLRRALRAEIDEAAWSSLYSTESRPFATPASNKIAVKVINHYGDEVLKVFEV